MANTDYFIKGARRFSTTIGVGGVANDSATTVPITTFPSDYSDNDAVAIVVDRVDTSGALTPDFEEVIIGVKSGSNLINCVRGVEGTAQAHAAGKVVEIKLFKSVWNRFITGVLVEHNQDGTHKAMTSPSFTTPKVTTSINDSNGNELIKVVPTSSAVNEIQVTNAATGNRPVVEATGGDSTVSTQFKGKSAFNSHTGEYDNGNSGTSKAINWANGDRQKVTMTGNCSFTYSNAAAGQTLTLRLIEDGTGGYSVTLPTSKWPGGNAGAFTTTANAINLLIVYFDGTNYLTQLAAGFA